MTCPECNGLGKHGTTGYKCPSCEGSGKVCANCGIAIASGDVCDQCGKDTLNEEGAPI